MLIFLVIYFSNSRMLKKGMIIRLPAQLYLVDEQWFAVQGSDTTMMPTEQMMATLLPVKL